MSSSSIYGAAAAPITISGISSGIDTSSIITELTNEEAKAETGLTNQQTALNTQLTEWQTFNTTLTSLQDVSAGLNHPSSFNTTDASIDQTAVATVTTNGTPTVGSHTLTVTSLAQAQSVLSGSFTDASTPLNLSGSFSLNGAKIAVTSSDTLNSLETKINAANVGVTATTISTGTGSEQLSLSSTSTGTINGISASDIGTGNVLEGLGLVPTTGATTGLRQTITGSNGNGGAGSLSYTSSSQDIGALTGNTNGSAASGTIQIDGTSVALNLNTMSLTDVANAINSAGISGVKAQIVGIPDANGNVSPSSAKQLQIVSTNGTPLTASSFTDSNGVLANLGITQTGFANQTTAAKDAAFTLDGVNYTRSSNTVNDAISDVTLSLLSTNTSSTSTPANISVSADTASVSSAISSFVTSYNGVIDAINQEMTYSGSTKSGAGDQSADTPPLFGNSTLQSIQSQLASLMNVTNGKTTLASIGITIGSSGDLTVDSSKLNTALTSNPTGVEGLFATVGSTSASDLTYDAAGTTTAASSGAGYAVDITQAATQATATASNVLSTLSQNETLSFSGGLFGSSTTSIAIASGSSLQDVIDDINGDTNLNQYLYATQDSSGHLLLSSKGYGSNQSFTVTSNVNGAGSTGFGTSGVTASGMDVEGTINGEPATGQGQSLMGNSTNKTTSGLQLTYTGTAIGNVGSVSVTQGLATQLASVISGITDASTGSIQAAEAAINSQVTALGTQITQIQTQVNNYQTQLETEFANMETSISNLKTEQAAFDSEAGITTSSSSTGSSTGTSSTSSKTV